MSNKLPTLLVLSSTFPRWPNDKEPPFVYELSRRLTQYFNVIVLAPHCEGAKRMESFDKISVYRFRYCFDALENLCYQGGINARLKENPFRYLLLPGFFFFQTLAILRLIRTVRPDAIHAHWIIPQGLSAAIALHLIKHKPALMITSHGGDLYALKGKLFNGLKRWVLNRSDQITLVNSAMQQALSNMGVQKKARIIPMGVDVKQTFVDRHLPRKPFSLLFTGRLVEKKGLSYLLDALPEVLHHYPETTLTIIGTGPLESKLKQQAETLDILNCVRFLGAIENSKLSEYYQTHAVAVYPFVISDNGDREGLPVVVSEAMGCGCPVITTNLPGMEDLITHHENGVMIESKSVPNLTQAICDLFAHPDKAKQLADAALTEVHDKQDWDKIAWQYQALLVTPSKTQSH